MGRVNERETKANVLTRRFDEIAVAAGCDLPGSVLTALVRLFGEALDAQPTSGHVRTWSGRDQGFSRCGAVDHTIAGRRPRCIRRSEHAGQHFAVTGEQWGPDSPVEADQPPERLVLLCFAGACEAVATVGRFCARHSRPGGIAEGSEVGPTN
jgi:hypothetical protein